MKKAAALFTVLGIIVPQFASAHEHYQYEIGHTVYEIVIGSLAEPVIVDDKTGIDFRVSKAMMDHDMHAESGTPHSSHSLGASAPVVGLEATLKAELISSDTRRIVELSPVYATPGSYKAAFYPTHATTLSYRIFGTIEGVPFDQTYTCNPAGHNVAPEDLSRVEVSEGVTRTLKSGAFSCPVEKAALGFPGETATIAALTERIDYSERLGYGAGALALLSLVAGYIRRK